MRVNQKISLQHIYFGFFICNSNKKSSDITVLLYSTIFPHSTHHNWELRHISYRATSFSVPCWPKSHVLRYQPLCHYCFHLTISFKSVATKTLLQHRKQMKIAQQIIPLIKSQSVLSSLQNYKPCKFIFWSALVHYIIFQYHTGKMTYITISLNIMSVLNVKPTRILKMWCIIVCNNCHLQVSDTNNTKENMYKPTVPDVLLQILPS